ncbi:MAG TPA: hypothetical protein VIK72_16690 [Clostridiaceae bacterium]
MIEDSTLEKLIRDRISSEKMTFPEGLDKRINNVLRELPQVKEKTFPWTVIVAVAAFTLILITSSLLFKGMTKDNLLAVVKPPQSGSKILAASNEKLIKKYKSEGYIVDKNTVESAKIQGGTSNSDRIRAYVSLEELVAASDIIIQGEVIGVKYFDDSNYYTYTESKVLVTKSYNNKISTGEVVTFYESGGFTTKYNMILQSGAKEKFGDKYYEIGNTTPEEEEKAKSIIVYSHSYDGDVIMQPEDKVLLFGIESKEPIIQGTYYSKVGGFDGKFNIKDDIAKRNIPQGEFESSLEMTTKELSERLTDIVSKKK